MKFLTKEDCPLKNVHSVPLYYGTVNVYKLVNTTKGMRVESEITFIKQVLKGFNEEEVWERFESKIELRLRDKKQTFTEVVKFKDKHLTRKDAERFYEKKSVTIEKHLGFGIDD